MIGLFYRRESEFRDQERNVLVALGSSIAQSLARAMLYDQEHDLAAGLQQAMLPRRIPGVPDAQVAVRYRSARLGRDIGGDWYDVIPLPNGRVAAVVGDVQGHDTQAAALMGQLRIVLRAYAAEGHAPATVMARASAFLNELDTDRFATCIYVDADLSTGAARFVRAGHIDPLLRHAEGICRRLPVAGGLPLGISSEFKRLDYPVTTIHLAAGDTLVLCTDGLVEQPGSRPRRRAAAAGPRGPRGPPGRPATRRPALRVGGRAQRRGRHGAAAAAPPRRPGARHRGTVPAAHRARRPPRALRRPAHDPGGRTGLGRARSAPRRSSWSPTS